MNLTEEQKAYLKKNESRRSKCEVWSRVMGYHRPVQYFNNGKQAEFRERKQFKESIAVNSKQMKEAE